MLENYTNPDKQGRLDLLHQQSHMINYRKQQIYHSGGMRVLILARNKLGDKFANSLQKTLNYDKYMKVIDVAGNKIS